MGAWSLLDRAFGWGGVLAYHGVGEGPHMPVMHISPGRLRAQLGYLRDEHTVVTLRDLVGRWRRGESTSGCVAITFDDSYAGVALYALPILRELNLPATVFVTSNHASQGGMYWWDVVEQQRIAVRSGSWTDAPATIGLHAFDADDPAAMERVRSRVLAHYAGRWPGGIAAGGTNVWRSLKFSELTALANDELIDFGVHTISHPVLPFLPYEEQVSEMRDNLKLLRERLPRVLPVVAYPYGLYDRTTVRAAMEAGMIAGLTMEGRATANRPYPMTVPRIGAGDIHTPESRGRRLSRALRPALILRNGGFHPRLPSDPITRPRSANAIR